MIVLYFKANILIIRGEQVRMTEIKICRIFIEITEIYRI